MSKLEDIKQDLSWLKDLRIHNQHGDDVAEAVIEQLALYVMDTDELYRKYLQAKAMQEDERSMSYIAKRLGYKYPSGVKYLIDKFERAV